MNQPYSDTYLQRQIETAPRERLILMLYDGLSRNLSNAQAAIANKDIESAHLKLMKAQDILVELLRSLNLEAGGELAHNLFSLYDFMVRLLIEANLRKDSTLIQRVQSLLEPIREGWEQAVVTVVP